MIHDQVRTDRYPHAKQSLPNREEQIMNDRRVCICY